MAHLQSNTHGLSLLCIGRLVHTAGTSYHRNPCGQRPWLHRHFRIEVVLFQFVATFSNVLKLTFWNVELKQQLRETPTFWNWATPWNCSVQSVSRRDQRHCVASPPGRRKLHQLPMASTQQQTNWPILEFLLAMAWNTKKSLRFSTILWKKWCYKVMEGHHIQLPAPGALLARTRRFRAPADSPRHRAVAPQTWRSTAHSTWGNRYCRWVPFLRLEPTNSSNKKQIYDDLCGFIEFSPNIVLFVFRSGTKKAMPGSWFFWPKASKTALKADWHSLWLSGTLFWSKVLGKIEGIRRD